MEILYQDEKLVVCIKPAGVLSTDEPGGLPELLREYLGTDNIRTVHRLDRVVGGVMVLARTARAASDLSAQIREGVFEKEYTALIHGKTPEEAGTFRDYLFRDKTQRKSFVVSEAGREAQEAVLHYRTLGHSDDLSLVRIRLETGRTHQIRAQFSGRGLPLVGDKKYGLGEECPIGLWSTRVAFIHPAKNIPMEFEVLPPETEPWTNIK